MNVVKEKELFQIAIKLSKKAKFKKNIFKGVAKAVLEQNIDIYSLLKLHQTSTTLTDEEVSNRIDKYMSENSVSSSEETKIYETTLSKIHKQWPPAIFYPIPFLHKVRRMVEEKTSIKEFGELMKKNDPEGVGVQQSYLYRLFKADRTKGVKIRSNTQIMIFRSLGELGYKKMSVKVNKDDFTKVYDD